MNNNRANIEIDLKQITINLLRRCWLILLVGILVAALAFGYAAFMITPLYASSVQLYVNNTYGNNTQGFSSSQLAAAQSLASTYIVILGSRDVLTEIAAESGLGYSAGQIQNMITASAVNETEVFRVTVTCADYVDAAKIANAVAEVLPKKIAAYIEGSSMVVVEHATENPNPISPDTGKFAVIGFLLGCAIVVVIVVVRDLMDTTINSEEYLTQAYEDLPLLAVVPDAENPRSGSGYRGYYESQKVKNSEEKGGAK